MKILIAAFATVAVLSVQSWAGDDKPTAEAFYAKKCASCHAKDGKGNAKMAKMFKVEAEELDLTTKEALGKKDEEIAKVILKGEKKMPKFEGKLGELDVKDLVAYLRGLAPKKKEK